MGRKFCFRPVFLFPGHSARRALCRGNKSGGVCLALADEVAEFHEGGGGIAKGEERVGVLLDGEADAGLGAGDVVGRGKLGHANVLQVALGLDAETLEGALADAAGDHSDIGDDGGERRRWGR